MRSCDKCSATALSGAKFIRRNNKVLHILGFKDLCSCCALKMESVSIDRWYIPVNNAVLSMST